MLHVDYGCAASGDAVGDVVKLESHGLNVEEAAVKVNYAACTITRSYLKTFAIILRSPMSSKDSPPPRHS